MHIEAELDDVHADRLLELQQRLQKPLSEVLAVAIDAALWQQDASKLSGYQLFRAFERAGLFGYLEAEQDLSVNFNQLDFSGKHGK
jgi:hypothetical protein